MRLSAKWVAGSSSAPLSVMLMTRGAIRSMNVSAPFSAAKRTCVVLRKVGVLSVSPVVRSSSTSYSEVSTMAARACASARVRFFPGMHTSCHVRGAAALAAVTRTWRANARR